MVVTTMIIERVEALYVATSLTSDMSRTAYRKLTRPVHSRARMIVRWSSHLSRNAQADTMVSIPDWRVF